MSDRENVDAITLLNEPGLEFRYNQRVADPHAGLSLFGPYDADLPAHPKGIVYGLIGTPEGTDAFEGWSQRIRKPILTEGHPTDELLDRKKHALWPPISDSTLPLTQRGTAGPRGRTDWIAKRCFTRRAIVIPITAPTKS